MIFILASNNSKKLTEMRQILSKFDIEVVSQKEAGLSLDVEETGTTFAENAFLKADAAAKASGHPAIADDSGLCIEALNGEPGIYSARYGGGNLTDSQKYMLILENMKGKENRNAKFVSSIACVFPNGDILTAEGECKGQISEKPMGENGFGYDPIFYIPELEMSMAELNADEKNAISHRGKALKLFEMKLKEYINSKG